MGPTTNFVGNHMTQAAIDLVQAHLQPPREPVSNPGALRLTQGAEHGPKLLQVTPPQSEQHAGSPIRALDRYRWQDAAESVDISVELPQNGPWDVTCEVTRGSLMLEARPQRGPQLRLHIPALCHAVTPEACRVIVACGEDHGEQAAVPSVSGVWAWKGHLPGGTLLLHLHKEQEGMQWQRLAAQKEDAGGDGARVPAAPAAAPDLDATRSAQQPCVEEFSSVGGLSWADGAHALSSMPWSRLLAMLSLEPPCHPAGLTHPHCTDAPCSPRGGEAGPTTSRRPCPPQGLGLSLLVCLA